MQLILLLVMTITLAAQANTKLFMFGGGHRPEAALEAFTHYAGSENSFILVIPWASIDNEGAENIQRDLSKYSAGEIQIASPNANELRAQVARASGIFFSGGEQVKLMSIMNSLNLRPVFKELYARGVVFAGTSAGTAIMSEKMITGEGDFDVLDGTKVELAQGLGLLPSSVIVDQHFIVRSRYNRLSGLVLNHQALGLAIDENNAFLIDDNKEATAFGPTHVLFFSPEGPSKYSVEVFNNGDKINLRNYSAFNE
jgi:cyanophycinase